MKKYSFILISFCIQNILFAQIPATYAGATGSLTFTYNQNTETYPIVRTNNNRLWTLKNLGAGQVAQAADDTLSYGHYFQWGRWDDGHQLRYSPFVPASTINPNNPLGLNGGNIHFLSSPPNSAEWWEAGNSSDSWNAATPSAVTSKNGCDPCKAIGPEWRLPTGNEYITLLSAENIDSPEDGFLSNMKFSLGGFRNPNDNTLVMPGLFGYYWVSNAGSIAGRGGYMNLYHDATQPNSKPGVWYTFHRRNGLNIRCIRNCQDIVVNIKDTICSGSSFQIGTKLFTTSGTYTEKLWAYYGCDSTVTVELFVTPPPTTTLDTAICSTDSILFNSLYFKAPATYNYIVSDSNGCNMVRALNLQLAEDALDLGKDTTLCTGEILKLQIPSYFSTVAWNDGSTDFTKEISTAGTYSVQAEVCNKTAMDTIQVTFAQIQKVSAPNVFTPNNDGQNDFFEMIYTESNIDLNKFRLSVYNRWGNLILESTDKDISWDGTINNQPISEGIYYYAIDIYNGCQNQEKGYFYIFR